jgi:hypothetical protein
MLPETGKSRAGRLKQKAILLLGFITPKSKLASEADELDRGIIGPYTLRAARSEAKPICRA